MKHILSILTLVILSTLTLGTAQAQDYETYTFLLHKNNGLALAINTTNNTVEWAGASPESVTLTSQQFYIQRNSAGLALIISLEEPTLALRRDASNQVSWGVPASDQEADYLWAIDFAGEDNNGNGLCLLADPTQTLRVLTVAANNALVMSTFSAATFNSGDNEALLDDYRFRITKAYNTF